MFLWLSADGYLKQVGKVYQIKEAPSIAVVSDISSANQLNDTEDQTVMEPVERDIVPKKILGQARRSSAPLAMQTKTFETSVQAMVQLLNVLLF